MPRKFKQCDTFRLSPRIILRPGNRLRFPSGGPVYHGDDGEQHRLPLTGCFKLRSIIRRGKRFWFEVAELSGDDIGAVRTVLVSGRSYHSEGGLLIRPYNVRRLRHSQSTATTRRPR